ncbi:FMN-binding protein [Neobacillus sp. PS3-34]|uniref:FMN-binding protein n=1 Tax=Neobacillus sp. PS3-34 TaxID=3070678 RepID=UPI0027E15FDC|nr:FMN-binding protein [Neobacillus sp. PS3-34]WML49045.1 FMN-binding protein [Neobacillus sp. PS3-34]
MGKMDKKWVILCSTAVAGVYAAGFFSTETQATKLETQQHAQISMQTNGGNSSAVSTKTKQLYKDGTFTGTGMNRRGSIEVAVTIKNDKITDVEISNFAMHYSEDDIVGLPDEVLQTQSAQVMNVSGATYSTQAFEDAVQEALYQRQNA